jgi:hypothetical protein
VSARGDAGALQSLSAPCSFGSPSRYLVAQCRLSLTRLAPQNTHVYLFPNPRSLLALHPHHVQLCPCPLTVHHRPRVHSVRVLVPYLPIRRPHPLVQRMPVRCNFTSAYSCKAGVHLPVANAHSLHPSVLLVVKQHYGIAFVRVYEIMARIPRVSGDVCIFGGVAAAPPPFLPLSWLYPFDAGTCRVGCSCMGVEGFTRYKLCDAAMDICVRSVPCSFLKSTDSLYSDTLRFPFTILCLKPSWTYTYSSCGHSSPFEFLGKFLL